MESSSPHTGVTMLKQTSRRLPSSIQLQDLWSAIRDGSITGLEPALLALKKNGGNIDTRNAFGSTALHIAVWRNHVPIVRRLLAAGADPNARDGESGWSSLHRALHFGHLAVAGVLIEAGASLTLEDSKGRSPVDLLSGPVQQVFETNNEGITEFYSWGNGANYQLGTGNSRIQKFPCKVEAFQGLFITAIAAAKFHSVAVTALGELYTWGYGRGGRLGHPDFDIHSGQAAVITPRQLTFGLGQRRVKVIAAAKHHTIVATQGGEVFTWGSNREGQLGYNAVDTQPTPRRVSFLRTRVIAVAAANKHSAAVTEPGEIYTWGCNREAQLGYGTSNSASNYVPRAVEALKGKCFVAVSAAKYHTVALGSDGEVFTWGYKMVSPRRVTISRNIKKSGNIPLKFHRMERLHVTSIAAGMTHSTALSDDGSLFYWVSSDPNLHCQQLYSMTTCNVVSVSSGKHWTTIVTSTGDVYAWNGKEDKEGFPIPQRVHGIKRAISASVGENHFLAVSAVYIPKYPPKCIRDIQMPQKEQYEETDDFEDDNMTNDYQNDIKDSGLENERPEKCVPSLKDLCQKVAAESLVESRTSLQLLDVADTLGAEELRMHCEDLVLRNLDYILTISPAALGNVCTELLSKLETSLDSKSSEPWSYRCLPTPTATFPAVIDSEEDDKIEFSRLRNIASPDTTELTTGERRSGERFLQQSSASDIALAKQIRAIRKKLQQIEMLEMKQRNGHSLDHQQEAKLQTKPSLENALHSLESGIAVECDEEIKLASIKAISLDDRSILRNELGSHWHKGKKKNNKSKQVQIENLPETSKIDMLTKAGLEEKHDELLSEKGFNNDRNGFYNEEEGIMVENGIIDLIVHCLARQKEAAPQAVYLMRLLSENQGTAEKISHARNAVLFLVTLIQEEEFAGNVGSILENLPKSDNDVITMAEANIMRPLVSRLIEGECESQILMAKTLGRLHMPDRSKEIVATTETISTLIEMMNSDDSENHEGCLAAVKALESLSSVPSISRIVENVGGIQFLVKQLNSVKSSGTIKTGAAHVLANIFTATVEDYAGKSDREAELEELIIMFLSLMGPITAPDVHYYILQGMIGLANGNKISLTAKTKMKEKEAFKLLINLWMAATDRRVKERAVELFRFLSRSFGNDACSALKEKQGSVNVILDMLKEGYTESDHAVAASILADLPPKDKQILMILLQANIMPQLVKLLENVNDVVVEASVGALLRFCMIKEHQPKLAEMKVIQKMVSLLCAGRSLTKERAALALYYFSMSTPSLSKAPYTPCWSCFSSRPHVCKLHRGICSIEDTNCLLEASAIKPLVQVLKEQDMSCVHAALRALTTLVDDNVGDKEFGYRLIAQENGDGIVAIIGLISSGTPEVQEICANLCEKFFTFPEYRNKYGVVAQMHIIGLVQKGSSTQRQIAGRILRQLELLHSQSNYFAASAAGNP